MIGFTKNQKEYVFYRLYHHLPKEDRHTAMTALLMGQWLIEHIDPFFAVTANIIHQR